MQITLETKDLRWKGSPRLAHHFFRDSTHSNFIFANTYLEFLKKRPSRAEPVMLGRDEPHISTERGIEPSLDASK